MRIINPCVRMNLKSGNHLMIYKSKSNNGGAWLSTLVLLIMVGCGGAEEVAQEPTPRPVVAATEQVEPTAEPTPIPEPTLEPTAVVEVEPTAEPKPTIDPANDGTNLKVPVLQAEPIRLTFEEFEDGYKAAAGGPIAPASSVSYMFRAEPGQTFSAIVEGDNLGWAILLNGNGIPPTKYKGRAQVWEFSQGGDYEFAISNGGPGTNYTFDLGLSHQADIDLAALPPEQIPFSQGVTNATVNGELDGENVKTYWVSTNAEQAFTFVLTGVEGSIKMYNESAGYSYESDAGTPALTTPPLPAGGEYTIEIDSDASGPFELAVTVDG